MEHSTWFRYRLVEYFVNFHIEGGKPVAVRFFLLNKRKLRAVIPDEYAQGRGVGYSSGTNPWVGSAPTIKVFGETEMTLALDDYFPTEDLVKAFEEWIIPQIVVERLS